MFLLKVIVIDRNGDEHIFNETVGVEEIHVAAPATNAQDSDIADSISVTVQVIEPNGKVSTRIAHQFLSPRQVTTVYELQEDAP